MRLLKIVAVALAMTAATGANALSVTFGSVEGEWSSFTNAKGGTKGIKKTDDGAKIYWGANKERDSSSYVFDAMDTSTFDLTSESSDFKLGSFAHNNIPISGGSLGTGTLDVTISGFFGLDPSNSFSLTSSFLFEHDETPNKLNGECKYGGPKPCADRVILKSVTPSSDSLIIGGIEYVLDLSGFVYGDNKVALAFFDTQENKSNEANLMASLVTRESIENDPPAVPLPASALLLGVAVAGLMGRSRLRRKP